MSKHLLIALTALSIAGASLPAMAAGVPFCDATADDISTNEASIAQRLEAQGYQVSSIQERSGCVQATVTKAGKTEILNLDPTYLTPVGSTAQV